MSNLIIKEHNLTTGEIVEREMTTDEYETHLKQLKEQSEIIAKQEAAKAAKAQAEAKLIALGLDLDDLRALGL